MDPENLGKEAVIRVTDWLRSVWEMRRMNSAPVQQWVDSIPLSNKLPTSTDQILQESALSSSIKSTEATTSSSDLIKEPSMTVSISVPNSPAITMTGLPSSTPYHSRLVRDPSLQSDSSHCSSVESLLELRKADPEAILLGLGFGGCSNSPQENGPLSRIPKRFLQPSKLKGIDINEFVKHQQEASESLDSASLGYRGLTGSPYVAPSEIVQKIMERLHEHESHERDAHNMPYDYSSVPDGRLSVLSPDNRHFLEQPRSKSPDMRNKRMIIGEKSFAFGNDGDLIELDNSKDNWNNNNPVITKQEDNSNNVILNTENTLGPNCRRYKNSAKETNAVELEESSSRNVATLTSATVHESNNNTSNLNADTQMDYHKRNDKNVGLCMKERDRFSETVISKFRNEDVCSSFKRSPKDINNGEESFSNTRRSSEGAHTELLFSDLVLEDGRRFSDGVMHTMLKNNRITLADRRASLKRQARITEADAKNY